jgi:F-type H+-transporting ATPase subunit a
VDLSIASNMTVLAEFHAPAISEFFPGGVLFTGTPFELNRVGLVRLVGAIAIGLLLFLGTRKMKLVPGRFQSCMEMLWDFVRVGIAQDTMGKKNGEKFLPVIATIFFMVLGLNVTGFIPFLNISGASVIGVPLVLALVVYFTYHIAGIQAKGLGGYLKDSLILPGVPWPLHVLMIPIEFLTKFVIQPFTLTLRLLCNMIVGHLLLVLCFSATWFFFFDASMGFKVFGVVTILGGFFVTLLEILIAVLQAYIFALLAAVYINQAISDEH